MAAGDIGGFPIAGGFAADHGYARWFKAAYSDQVYMKAQQLDSRLAGLFARENIEGETFRVQAVKAQPTSDLTTNAARFAANVVKEVTTEYRVTSPAFFDYTFRMDPRDAKGLMRAAQPNSQMLRALGGMFNTKLDSIVITALDAAVLINDLADAVTAGVVNGTSTAFLSDGGTEVDVVAEGEDLSFVKATPTATISDASLSTRKLLKARELLQTNNALLPGEDAICLCHPIQAKHLLRDAQAQNFDYNDLRPLIGGETVRWAGFQIITTNAIPSSGTDPWAITTGNIGDAQTGRYAYVCTRDSLVVGVDPIDVKMDIDFTRHHSLQVAHYAQMAALRLDGAKIVRIECVDAW